MEVLIQAAQFFLSLSILIVLHELGHFVAARAFGVKVEKFYLFFNPWFSLFKKQIGDTEYGIGWIPLGGYVKISGMIDESMDREQMKEPAQPWEFRSKPAWQRLIIMLGGVTVNAILGIIIFAGLAYRYGDVYLPAESVKYGVYTDSIGHAIGIRDGDKILEIGGEKVEKFKSIPYLLIMREARTITVERNGEIVTLEVPPGTISQLVKHRKAMIVAPRFPVVVKEVAKDSEAGKAGLQPGDRIIAVNGEEALFFDLFDSLKRAHIGEEIDLSVLRDPDTVHLKVLVPDNGVIGFIPYPPTHFLKLDTIRYNLAEALPAGMRRAYSTFTDYIAQIKLIFTSDEIKASESVGGFISIGSIFGTTWDWQRFWTMTAWLSIILAFMNVLPIPALDGGHVVFLLFEMITGKEPPQKVLEVAQIIGMVILISLLIFANFNDVRRLIFGN